MTSHSRLEYVIDNLLKCLSETQGAAVALRKRKNLNTKQLFGPRNKELNGEIFV